MARYIEDVIKASFILGDDNSNSEEVEKTMKLLTREYIKTKEGRIYMLHFAAELKSTKCPIKKNRAEIISKLVIEAETK